MWKLKKQDKHSKPVTNNDQKLQTVVSAESLQEKIFVKLLLIF